MKQALPGCSYSSNCQVSLMRTACPGVNTNVELIRGVSPLQTQTHDLHHHCTHLHIPHSHHCHQCQCLWVYNHGHGNTWPLHWWWSMTGSRHRQGPGGSAWSVGGSPLFPHSDPLCHTRGRRSSHLIIAGPLWNGCPWGPWSLVTL